METPRREPVVLLALNTALRAFVDETPERMLGWMSSVEPHMNKLDVLERSVTAVASCLSDDDDLVAEFLCAAMEYYPVETLAYAETFEWLNKLCDPEDGWQDVAECMRTGMKRARWFAQHLIDFCRGAVEVASARNHYINHLENDATHRNSRMGAHYINRWVTFVKESALSFSCVSDPRELRFDDGGTFREDTEQFVGSVQNVLCVAAVGQNAEFDALWDRIAALWFSDGFVESIELHDLPVCVDYTRVCHKFPNGNFSVWWKDVIWGVYRKVLDQSNAAFLPSCIRLSGGGRRHMHGTLRVKWMRSALEIALCWMRGDRSVVDDDVRDYARLLWDELTHASPLSQFVSEREFVDGAEELFVAWACRLIQLAGTWSEKWILAPFILPQHIECWVRRCVVFGSGMDVGDFYSINTDVLRFPPIVNASAVVQKHFEVPSLGFWAGMHLYNGPDGSKMKVFQDKMDSLLVHSCAVLESAPTWMKHVRCKEIFLRTRGTSLVLLKCCEEEGYARIERFLSGMEDLLEDGHRGVFNVSWWCVTCELDSGVCYALFETVPNYVSSYTKDLCARRWLLENRHTQLLDPAGAMRVLAHFGDDPAWTYVVPENVVSCIHWTPAGAFFDVILCFVAYTANGKILPAETWYRLSHIGSGQRSSPTALMVASALVGDALAKHECAARTMDRKFRGKASDELWAKLSFYPESQCCFFVDSTYRVLLGASARQFRWLFNNSATHRWMGARDLTFADFFSEPALLATRQVGSPRALPRLFEGMVDVFRAYDCMTQQTVPCVVRYKIPSQDVSGTLVHRSYMKAHWDWLMKAMGVKQPWSSPAPPFQCNKINSSLLVDHISVHFMIEGSDKSSTGNGVTTTFCKTLARVVDESVREDNNVKAYIWLLEAVVFFINTFFKHGPNVCRVCMPSVPRAFTYMLYDVLDDASDRQWDKVAGVDECVSVRDVLKWEPGDFRALRTEIDEYAPVCGLRLCELVEEACGWLDPVLHALLGQICRTLPPDVFHQLWVCNPVPVIEDVSAFRRAFWKDHVVFEHGAEEQRNLLKQWMTEVGDWDVVCDFVRFVCVIGPEEFRRNDCMNVSQLDTSDPFQLPSVHTCAAQIRMFRMDEFFAPSDVFLRGKIEAYKKTRPSHGGLSGAMEFLDMRLRQLVYEYSEIMLE